MTSILETALADDPGYGGTQRMLYAKKGGGKSYLLSTWAIQDFRRGHTVIWRAKDADSWTIFSNRYPVQVIVPDRNYTITRETREGKPMEFDPSTVFTEAKRPDDAVAALKNDMINVIIVEGETPLDETAWWTVFLGGLIKHAKGWTSLFLDEINDIIPAKPSGDRYFVQDKFKSYFASCRKRRIHVAASAHIFHDVDYNISYKFLYTIYMNGALLLPKKRTALRYKTLIDKLQPYQFIIDNISGFELVDYSPLPSDIATGEVVTFGGPGWSINNYPSLMMNLGLFPMVTCSNEKCNRPVRVRPGMATCPWCGTEVLLFDRSPPGLIRQFAYGSVDTAGGGMGIGPMGSIDRKEEGQNPGHVRGGTQDSGSDLNTKGRNQEKGSGFAEKLGLTNPGKMTESEFMNIIHSIINEDLTEEQIHLVKSRVMNIEFNPGDDVRDVYDQAIYEIRKILGSNATEPSAEDPREGEKQRKRKWSRRDPKLVEESERLRDEAMKNRKCANCEKKLEGQQIYYCSRECKEIFYEKHPLSLSWNQLRHQALVRDNHKCVKCGGPAEEVDHILELRYGGDEFDLGNLQSLCHSCHVEKTNGHQ